MNKRKDCKPTSHEHDHNGEGLLGVGVGTDVPEADRGEAGEGEVEGRDVLGLESRTRTGAPVVELVRLRGQSVEPTDLRIHVLVFGVANCVPN